MLRSLVTSLGLIFSWIITSADGAACENFSDRRIGVAYENAETDTVVATLDVEGTVGTEITLQLTDELATFFRLDGKDILVKDSSTLDRSSPELEPSGLNSYVIKGKVTCDTGSDSLFKDHEIEMIYTNRENPTLIADSSIDQTEFTRPNTVIYTLISNDGENTGYDTTVTISEQDPPGYFDVVAGELTLIKELDYETSTSIVLTLRISDEGYNSTGGSFTRTIESQFTVNVEDYDDTNPIFTTCDSADCIPQVYTANVSVQTTGPLTVQPQEISAFDGDTAIDVNITYSLVGGSPEYDTYFEIDSSTGIVSVTQEIDSEGVFILAVRAQQSDATNRFAIAYLQVDAYVRDESKPEINVTQGNIGNVVAIDSGNDIIYVRDEGTQDPILLDAEDGDDVDANLLYKITPDYFQVSRAGEVYAFRGDLFSTTRAPITLEITAVNIDASTNSPNRISEPITMIVVTVEMTTQATTEVTTIPDTTQQTSMPVTTEQSTTEPTTFETTTFVDTTTMMTSVEPTTSITTTVVDTTMQQTTDGTTMLPTTTVTTEDTTLPDTTTYSTTDVTTLVTTPQPTTSAEATTVTTSLDTTFSDDTTTPEPTTDISTTQSSTAVSTDSTDGTTITTTEPVTTQQTSSVTVASTLNTDTSQTSAQTSFGSTTASTSISTDQTTAGPSTSATDVSTVTEMSTTLTDISSAATTDVSITSSPSGTTDTIPTSTPASTSGGSSTTQSDSVTESSTQNPSESTVSSVSDISQSTTPSSIPSVITESTTVSYFTKDGTIPDPTTPDGTIIEDLVPRSTLIGVAAGLSSVLFIAICIIVFLLWKLMHKDKKGDDDDNKSQTSSQTHSNDAYTEENETREEEPDEDKGAGTFGFSAAIAAGEMNESGVDMENDQDNSSQGEAVTDFGGGYDFGGNYEPAADPEDVETDPVVPIYAEVQRKHEVDEEVEDRPLPTSDFERELLDKANTMAVSAAAAATIAKSVEDSPAPAVAAEFTPNLPPEVVQEESVIKEDVFNSVKIVTLKGYGDDGVDVKAVLKSIDTEMATSLDVNAVSKRISIMEELSEMDHPNILRYYGSYVTDDSINYAVKFAENGNLRDTLRNGTLDSHAMMLMMANIGKGLQYLHAKNVTHGNVWAKAIMLDDSNTPMLTDIDGSTEASSEYKDIMRWQAAEVLNQTSGTSPATDVWSFGTLMWEIVSQGATPYEGVPLKELSSTVDREQLKRPKGCSQSLFNIMEKCWEKDTRKRPDMYVINSNLSEILLEDSNEHIRMNDNRGSISSKEDVSDIHNELSDSEDLTAF